MSLSEADHIETATDLGTLKRRSIHGAVSTAAAQVLRVVMQFATQVALARLLTPGDFGLVAMMAPVINLVQIFNELGLSQAAIQRVRITQQELSALFWINLAVSVTLAALLGAASPLVAWFYDEPRLSEVCLVLASLIVLSGLSAQQIALMNRTMRFVSLSIIDFSCLAVAVGVGIWCALAGLGYWSLVAMQAANSFTILLLAWGLSKWRPSFPRRTPGVTSMLLFGGHLTAFNLVTYAGSNLDSILLGRLKGPYNLGLYDRAFKLVAAPIGQISLPIARVADSLLARLQTNQEKYVLAYMQMLEALLLVTGPAVVFVAMTAERLVPMLMGAHWAAAAPIVAWLAVAMAFAPLSLSSYWLFVSQGRAAEQLRYVGVKTFFQILALLIGLPMGALGVARSYAICGILIHGSLLWGATASGPVGLRRVFHACMPFVFAGLGAVGAMMAYRFYAGPDDTLLSLALDFCACYGGFGITLVCQPRGQQIVRNLWEMRTSFQRASASA